MAEAFALGPKGLAHFYDTKELMQHRTKIVKYPVAAHGNDQGVGPHYDAGFLTFVRPFVIIQAPSLTNVPATPSISTPRFTSSEPIWTVDWCASHSWDFCHQHWKRSDDPFLSLYRVIWRRGILAFANTAFEFVTRGVARATSHRVLSPKGETPRYSVPFFQNISLQIRLADEILDRTSHCHHPIEIDIDDDWCSSPTWNLETTRWTGGYRTYGLYATLTLQLKNFFKYFIQP